MAIINLASLRLMGINVAGGVVAGLVRAGSKMVDGQTPTTFLSFTRHPSRYPADIDPTKRDEQPALRAGRLGRLPGVLRCRRFVHRTKQTMLWAWSKLRREITAVAWSITGPTLAPALAASGGNLSRHMAYHPEVRLQVGLLARLQSARQWIWAQAAKAAA